MEHQKTTHWASVAFSSVSILAFIFFWGGWLQQSVSFILQPLPIEYRDWAGIRLTEQFLTGGAPYSFTEGPPFFHIYGFVFPLFVALINAVIGVDLLFLTKLLVCVCVLLSAIVVAVEVHRLTKALHLSLIAFTLMLWTSWNENVFFVLRPDAFATLITVLSLSQIRKSQSQISLLVVTLGSIVLFYTKSYFIIIFFSVSLFLLLSTSWRNFLFFIIYFFLVFILSILTVLYIFPTYFYAAVIAQANAAGGDWGHAYTQFVLFYQNYWPLLVLVLMYLFRAAQFHRRNHRGNVTSTIRNFIFDVLGNRDIGIYACFLFIATLALLPLGKNTGAFLSYHHQLLIPSLSIIAMLVISRIEQHLLKKILISLTIVFGIFHTHLNYYAPVYSTTDIENWDIAKRELSSDLYSQVLVSSPILIGIRPTDGTIVLDDGQSEWYSNLQPNINSPKVFNLFRQQSINYWQNFEDFYRQIDKRIIRKEFDAIVVTKGHHPMISQIYLDEYYRKVKEINLKVGAQSWQIEFWQPNY